MRNKKVEIINRDRVEFTSAPIVHEKGNAENSVTNSISHYAFNENNSRPGTADATIHDNAKAGTHQPDIESDLEESASTSNEYVVDRIVRRRRCEDSPTRYEYLIKWFGHSEPTWEPTCHLYRSQVTQYSAAQRLPIPQDLCDAMQGYNIDARFTRGDYRRRRRCYRLDARMRAVSCLGLVRLRTGGSPPEVAAVPFLAAATGSVTICNETVVCTRAGTKSGWRVSSPTFPAACASASDPSNPPQTLGACRTSLRLSASAVSCITLLVVDADGPG